MKTKNIFKIVAVFLFVGIFTACVQDDDYSIPVVGEVEPNVTVTTTFALVNAMYTGSIVTFNDQGSDLVIEGYVISSDRTGNFYKSIFIQDSPENPSYGFRIDVDAYDTYLTYNVGRKVYVKLNNLYMDDENGVMAIGAATGTSLERISELEMPNYILRSTEVATIVPKLTTPSDIQAGNVPDGVLVQLNNMQVPISELGNSYANPGDTYTVNRNLVSCDDGGSVIVRNSGYSDFKAELMDQDRGTLTAVLSQYNSDKQLYIRETSDLDFNDSRCDPFFFESFNEAVDNTNLDIANWTNFAEAGGELWTEQAYSGNGYAEFSSYGTGDVSNIGWLVSPGIDMDAQTNEVLKFKSAQHHLDSAANTLEVFVSTDFDGTNVLAATWVPVSANLATMSDSWYDFVPSGAIDVSSYTGTMYVAFKVTGSGTDSQLDGAYHIEDVELLIN